MLDATDNLKSVAAGKLRAKRAARGISGMRRTQSWIQSLVSCQACSVASAFATWFVARRAARREGSEPVGRSPTQSTALRGEDGLAGVRAGRAKPGAKHCFARLERPATDGRPGGGNEKSPSAGRHQFAPIKANKPVMPALGVVMGRTHRQDATKTPSSTARRNAATGRVASALRERAQGATAALQPLAIRLVFPADCALHWRLVLALKRQNRPDTTLAMALCLVLAGCAGGGTDGASEMPQETGVSEGEVVLGMHTDLSGVVAIWGVGVRDGARMRFDEANAAGGVHGRKIRLVVEDTGYQVPRAIQAANKLIHRDKIFAMVLATGTPTNNAVLEEQLSEGVPNLFPLTGARSMAEPFHRLKFTARGIYYNEMRSAVRYFHEEMGKSNNNNNNNNTNNNNGNFCAMYHDSEYGLEILEAVEDQLSEMGLELVEHAAHVPTETEFTASVLKLKRAGCDVVLLGSVHRDTILILETARKMDWNQVVWVGNNAAYAQVIADQESGSGEGYYCFAHIARLYEDSIEDASVRAWWDGYLERFGSEPGLAAMEGYRNADLVVEALERAGRDLTREGLIAALESIDDYRDIFGYSVSFSAENHNGVHSSSLSIVEDGRFRKLEHEVAY